MGWKEAGKPLKHETAYKTKTKIRKTQEIRGLLIYRNIKILHDKQLVGFFCPYLREIQQI
jgi:hypothetical protein